MNQQLQECRTKAEPIILKFLEEDFIKRRNSLVRQGNTMKRYWKWVSTVRISDVTLERNLLDMRYTRLLLSRMCDDGKLKRKKMSGRLFWALATPPKGYEQHQFADYFAEI